MTRTGKRKERAPAKDFLSTLFNATYNGPDAADPAIAKSPSASQADKQRFRQAWVTAAIANHWEHGLKQGTQNNYKSALRDYCNWCIDTTDVDSAPDFCVWPVHRLDEYLAHVYAGAKGGRTPEGVLENRRKALLTLAKIQYGIPSSTTEALNSNQFVLSYFTQARDDTRKRRAR